MNTPALSSLLSYLFNALWQIPLLFAAAWIVARIARRAGPRAEHRIWVGTLLLQLVLPACNLHFREVRIAAVWNALRSLLPAHGNAGSGGVQVLLGPATAQAATLRLPFAFQVGIVLAWACVTLYFAARLAWGLVQTRRLARAATPLALDEPAAERWNRHCERFGIAAPPPQICASSAQSLGPVAVGLRRGIVLVPPQLFNSISPDDLNAVLAHELAHIARHDFAKNLLYTLLSLPIAWHPLLWRTRACLAESRELLCDDAAAEAVAGRRQYAQSLLRLASIFAGQPSVATLHAIGILDFNSGITALERRVMILTRKRIPMSTGRRILIASACSILALATCTSALALHTDVVANAPIADAGTPKTVHCREPDHGRAEDLGREPHVSSRGPGKEDSGYRGARCRHRTRAERSRICTSTKSPNQLLSDSAVKAVHTWRYALPPQWRGSRS